MKKKSLGGFRELAFLVLTLICALPGVSEASPFIIQPVDAITTLSDFNPIVESINQSGLSLPYVSGVTDFDAFTSSALHSRENNFSWVPHDSSPTGIVTLDLGQAYTVDRLAIWEQTGGGISAHVAISDFNVYADVDADFANGGRTLLGAYSTPTLQLQCCDGYPALIFAFEAVTTTRFVEIEILGYGHVQNDIGPEVFVGLVGEFALSGLAAKDPLTPPDSASVPEPVSLALLCAGLIGMGLLRRTRPL